MNTPLNLLGALCADEARTIVDSTLDGQWNSPITLARTVEDRLPSICRSVLHKHLAEFFPDRIELSASGTFYFRSEHFEFRVVHSDKNSRRLVLIFNRLTRGSGRSTTVDIKFPSFGRVNEIVLAASGMPPQFNGKDALSCACDVVSSVYAHLVKQTWEKLTYAGSPAAQAIYAKLRQLFPPELANNVLIYAIVDRLGYYLLDDEVTNSIFQRCMKVKNRSALEIALDFKAQLVPYDELFTKVARETKENSIASLGEAKYRHTGAAAAEQLIWNTDTVLVQPIAETDRIILSSGYPLSMRPQIETRLRSQADEFREIVQSYSSEIERGFQTLYHAIIVPLVDSQLERKREATIDAYRRYYERPPVVSPAEQPSRYRLEFLSDAPPRIKLNGTKLEVGNNRHYAILLLLACNYCSDKCAGPEQKDLIAPLLEVLLSLPERGNLRLTGHDERFIERCKSAIEAGDTPIASVLSGFRRFLETPCRDEEIANARKTLLAVIPVSRAAFQLKSVRSEDVIPPRRSRADSSC